MTYSCWPQERQ